MLIYCMCVCICVCVRAVCKEQQEPKAKRLKEVEAFVLSEEQRSLIQGDHGNKKVWDEALGFLTEGPVHTRTRAHTYTQVIKLYLFLITH